MESPRYARLPNSVLAEADYGTTDTSGHVSIAYCSSALRNAIASTPDLVGSRVSPRHRRWDLESNYGRKALRLH